jgi:hypothetical protein
MNTKFIFRFIFFCCSIFLIVSCSKGGLQSSLSGDAYILNGKADGTQLTPANGSLGTSNLTGWYDKESNTLNCTFNWTDLWTTNALDTISSIEFHGPSTLGVNAPILKNITIASRYSFSDKLSTSLSGYTGLTVEQSADLISGKWYYVICTKKYPNGLVRGQVNVDKR